jgi:hypothetical protein
MGGMMEIVDRLRAENAAWARLAEWGRGVLSPGDYDTRQIRFLDEGGGNDGIMLEQEDGRYGSYLYVEVMCGVGQYPADEPQTIWIGTPEREATMAECVAAALDLWARLHGEGKEGAK